MSDNYKGTAQLTELKVGEGTFWNDKVLIVQLIPEGTEPNSRNDFVAIGSDIEQIKKAFLEHVGGTGKFLEVEDMLTFSRDGSELYTTILYVTPDVCGYASGCAVANAALYANREQLLKIFDFIIEKWE